MTLGLLPNGGPIIRAAAYHDSTPHRAVWLRAARRTRMKKPRRSGAKFLAGVCPSRGKANPPIHYHSWLRSGDFAEKAPPEAEKAPPEGAGPAAERPNRQRQAHLPNAQPHRWLHIAQGETLARKSPAEAGLSLDHEGCRNASNGNPRLTVAW